VNGKQTRAVLDPGCESELFLSTRFATSCGIHSNEDDEIQVEFPNGTKVLSAAFGNIDLFVAGVAHLVRAIVV
jgi:hypothetical protein